MSVTNPTSMTVTDEARLDRRDIEMSFEDLTLERDRLREELEQSRSGPKRRRLPDTRRSITHKFSISGHEGYITVGLYEDGNPGEMFIKMAMMGSTVSGLVDTIAVLTSLALQYGVPVRKLADKLQHTRFEPSGHTTNSAIPLACSISDYVFTWLEKIFTEELGNDQQSGGSGFDAS